MQAASAAAPRQPAAHVTLHERCRRRASRVLCLAAWLGLGLVLGLVLGLGLPSRDRVRIRASGSGSV